MPFSKEQQYKPTPQDAHYKDDSDNFSDSGLLDEKPEDSRDQHGYDSSSRGPAWAPQYRVSGLIRSVRGSGGRMSRKMLAIVAFAIVLIVVGWTTLPKLATNTSSMIRESRLASAKGSKLIPSNGQQTRGWSKPKGFQIVGIVFYGRRVHVDILDCYLQQNLVSNGGYLDGVLFFQNTNDEEDIKYLRQLVDKEDRYMSVDFGADIDHWSHMWDREYDSNTMYFKIDDDLVYIHPDAIPLMTHTLMDHPEAHNVQANIINSPSTSWLHYHAGAAHPYLPEPVPSIPQVSNTTTWRASELPYYSGEVPEDRFDLEIEPTFNGHRWLPVNDSSASALWHTPVSLAETNPWGPDWSRWAIAAQNHYSFLQNIEDDTLDRYIFGNGESIYDPQFVRYKINLMAIWGRTINLERPSEDDESAFTEVIPRKLGMPVLVQTKALAAHFSFGPQRFLYKTDLIERYRNLANEFACAANNQKVEFPDWQRTLIKWGVKLEEEEKKVKAEDEKKEKAEEEKAEEKAEEKTEEKTDEAEKEKTEDKTEEKTEDKTEEKTDKKEKTKSEKADGKDKAKADKPSER